ncbi:hypothetical protein QT327_16615 [Olivibacter sp. 47]|jgi:hypothetical protein|uniref:hypothetical protein n=1 Tax=Olivibacter sp. 47 TaxID=3056486 RepID=UPI0025A4BC41|nr:hypothetical protein [Olivibacter sp. 47]MDM8175951.1 hypothetical protein [Olivibacter sp. 47]
MNSVQLYGAFCTAIGGLLWLLVQRRRFYRRGLGGLQHFRNFWTGLIVGVVEWAVAVVSILALLLGAFLLILGALYGN